MGNLAKKLRDKEDKEKIKQLTGITPKHRCPVCHRFSVYKTNGIQKICLMCEIIKQEREENVKSNDANKNT